MVVASFGIGCFRSPSFTVDLSIVNSLPLLRSHGYLKVLLVVMSLAHMGVSLLLHGVQCFDFIILCFGNVRLGWLTSMLIFSSPNLSPPFQRFGRLSVAALTFGFHQVGALLSLKEIGHLDPPTAASGLSCIGSIFSLPTSDYGNFDLVLSLQSYT